MNRLPWFALLSALVAWSAMCSCAYAGDTHADVIYINGKIHTLDAHDSRAEALAVSNGRLLFVGTNENGKDFTGPRTHSIDLKGRTVLPGLIDAHAHVLSLGHLKLSRLDLLNTRSYAEAIQRVAERAKQCKPGEWVIGARWDQANWGMKELPTHEKLSAATPNRPVMLSRVDGHCVLVNERAMQLSRITKATRNPRGGEVLKDARGEPTGILIDAASGLVRPIAHRKATASEELLAAQEACLAVGLTGVHDAALSPTQVSLYKKLCDKGKWKLRIYGMITAGHAASWCTNHKPLVDYADGRLTLRAIKCCMDGALGSRGAWLIEPYTDRPQSRGVATYSAERLAGICRLATKHGYQVCTHAIGDRANREVLDAYETVLKDHPKLDARWRSEHAQVVAVKDLPRFAKLGVLPSMQFTHATSDMRWAKDRLGSERLKGAYAWATLLKSGCRIPGGSDFPVESENPLWGVYAAVTRQDREGQPAGGWRSEECISRKQALRAFTIDAAYAAFEEKKKGTLETGKLADFVVFDRDVITCPIKELLVARVEMTVIGGEVVYEP